MELSGYDGIEHLPTPLLYSVDYIKWLNMRISMNYSIVLKQSIFGIILFLLPAKLMAQNTALDKQSIIYKTVNDTANLSIHFVYPENFEQENQWPLIIFYHGGGWVAGNWQHFLPQAKHFSELGFLCALPEYRLRDVHNATPFQSLMDAKSALRFVKANAKEFRIDTSSIIAAGGSAGGQLAAASHMVESYNDPRDNLQISTDVDALTLFNPVLDNGPEGYGYPRVGEEYRTFSPYHQPKENPPPTLIMLGTQDKLVPVKTMEEFCSQLETKSTPCKLVTYEGQDHGFFNNEPYLSRTIKEMENFLREQGFMD